MLFLMEARVNIGINPNADETTRHGVLWVKADPGNRRENKRIPVIIDQPAKIRDGLNYATWRRLKRQIEKMGIDASHLELEIGFGHYCYALDEYKELYAAPGKGRPLHTPGFA